MANKASGKSRGRNSKGGKGGTAVVRSSSSSRGNGSNNRTRFDAGDAFIKLLQSPLVAELVAVAATAAVAALAEHGFTTGGDGTRGKRAGKAVKEAGKAAAAAVGRRLGIEIDEIRQAATNSKAGAAA